MNKNLLMSVGFAAALLVPTQWIKAEPLSMILAGWAAPAVATTVFAAGAGFLVRHWWRGESRDLHRKIDTVHQEVREARLDISSMRKDFTGRFNHQGQQLDQLQNAIGQSGPIQAAQREQGAQLSALQRGQQQLLTQSAEHAQQLQVINAGIEDIQKRLTQGVTKEEARALGDQLRSLQDAIPGLVDTAVSRSVAKVQEKLLTAMGEQVDAAVGNAERRLDARLSRIEAAVRVPRQQPLAIESSASSRPGAGLSSFSYEVASHSSVPSIIQPSVKNITTRGMLMGALEQPVMVDLGRASGDNRDQL